MKLKRLSQNAILEDLKSQNVISSISENQQEGVLMSQIAISKPKERRGGTQKLPHVFTRNGIGYLLGASVKDIGKGLCAVTKMEVSPETVLALLK